MKIAFVIFTKITDEIIDESFFPGSAKHEHSQNLPGHHQTGLFSVCQMEIYFT